MPTQETLYNIANRVATITLNRPDKLNAWTALMESEVRSHMEAFNFHAVRCDRVVRNVFERIQKPS
jgi:enoyl-CoA hydratase/carnithine racemase